VIPNFQRLRLRARIFAAIVACLFLAQTSIAVAHAAALGERIGAVCLPQEEANNSESPIVPDGGHCQGFCCILHDGALDAPPLKPIASSALNFPAEALSLPPESSNHSPRIEPKRASQSPRAPPQQV
jgi:hypothetical protein